MREANIQTINGIAPFKLPLSWQVSTIADFKTDSFKKDAHSLAVHALKHPVGAAPLKEQLAPENSVCIIVEDLTRASPKKIILGQLLTVLDQIGISKDNISIVIALGTHRPLSGQELEDAFGKEVVRAYRFFNHDCHAPDLVPIGNLKTGASVKINRRVYEADFRIGIGSIFPHPLNGFGGGGKILFPGVADIHSIVEHHLKYSFRGLSFLGNTEGNPFYQEVTQMASAGRLDFIINTVLDHQDKPYQIVCGDAVKAHQAGINVCKEITSKQFKQKADITIISAFPYAEGPQIMKPLAPAAMITRKGGCIILHADCTVPLPDAYYETCRDFKARHGQGLRQAVLDHFADNRRIMPDAPPEMNMSMAQVMLTLNDFKVILATKDIDAQKIECLGFMAADGMDAAVGLAEDLFHEPVVNIVPSGGVILPIVS